MARRNEREEGQSSLDAFSGAPSAFPAEPTAPAEDLPSFDLPSLEARETRVRPAPTVPHVFHDLRNLYPAAPVPVIQGAPVIHRADLRGLEGVGQVMDWAADGDITLLDFGALFGKDGVLEQAIERLRHFIEDDIGGRLVQLTDTRLLVLPPGIEGQRGVEEQVGAVTGEDDGRRW